jgi:hypothetical protein
MNGWPERRFVASYFRLWPTTVYCGAASPTAGRQSPGYAYRQFVTKFVNGRPG